MVEVGVLALSVWISVIDLKSHRIPNELSISLGLLLLFDTVTTELSSLLIASVLVLLIAYLGQVGAGDVKLLLILTSTSGSLVLSQQYFLGMALISLSMLLSSFSIARLKGHKAPRSLAFAPSILAPFLALYLAI